MLGDTDDPCQRKQKGLVALVRCMPMRERESVWWSYYIIQCSIAVTFIGMLKDANIEKKIIIITFLNKQM